MSTKCNKGNKGWPMQRARSGIEWSRNLNPFAYIYEKALLVILSLIAIPVAAQ